MKDTLKSKAPCEADPEGEGDHTKLEERSEYLNVTLQLCEKETYVTLRPLKMTCITLLNVVSEPISGKLVSLA